MRQMIKTLGVVFSLAALSCIPGNSPIRVTGAFAVDRGTTGMDCKLNGTIQQFAGRLDASGGGDFLVVFGVTSEIDDQRQIVTANGVQLTGPGRKNWVLDGVALKYKLVDVTPPAMSTATFAMPEETIPLYGVVPPASDESRFLLDIIGELGAARLREHVTDPNATFLLTVSATLKGHLESGEQVPSNTINFPITVTTTNANCTDGQVTRTGICGSKGGQDGTPFACCTGPGTPVGCP